jgi:hypothetical protein
VKRNPALVAARIFEVVNSRRLIAGGATDQRACAAGLRGDS